MSVSSTKKNIATSATIATLSVAFAATAALAFAGPAAAAVSDPGSAQATIDRLEAQGNRVIISKVGSGGIDDCSVNAVRPGRDVTDVKVTARGNTEEVLRYTTVHVDLACQR